MRGLELAKPENRITRHAPRRLNSPRCDWRHLAWGTWARSAARLPTPRPAAPSVGNSGVPRARGAAIRHEANLRLESRDTDAQLYCYARRVLFASNRTCAVWILTSQRIACNALYEPCSWVVAHICQHPRGRLVIGRQRCEGVADAAFHRFPFTRMSVAGWRQDPPERGLHAGQGNKIAPRCPG